MLVICFLINPVSFAQVRCDILKNSYQATSKTQPNNYFKNRSKHSFQIVFHILYSNEEENIGFSQILSQIEVLNSIYDKEVNKQDLNIPSAFRHLKTNPDIHFCLANKDPNGQTSYGVTRTQINNISIACKKEFGKRSIMHKSLGGLDIWNPDQYINVFVVNRDDCDVLGETIYPWDATNEEDGIILDYRAVGFIGAATSNYPFHQGKTLVHEMGHYFGLKHLSDGATNCQSDDLVADTPPQDTEYFKCPTYPQSRCGNILMTMNYMCLVNDPCMHLFTKDQVTRMHMIIDQYRNKLLNFPCIGKTDTSINQLIWLYNEGFWQIKSPDNLPWKGVLELFDITGRLMWSGTVKETISISIPQVGMNLLSGVYFLRIQHDSQLKIFKLIKYS